MKRGWAGLFGMLVGAHLSACGTEPEEPSGLTIQVDDESGRGIPRAIVELGERNYTTRRETNILGRIHFAEGEVPWSLQPLSIDGCPFVEQVREFYRWRLVRDPELIARCRSSASWKVVGVPGEVVGWRERVWGKGLPTSRLDGVVRWNADLSKETRLDSGGRGVLSIPSLLDPFRNASDLRITVRGVSFRPGWWWLDPTDSVFHVPPITYGKWIYASGALQTGLLWGRDTLRYAWGGPLVWTGADGSRRTAKIRREDSVLTATWDDSWQMEFRWKFVTIEGALDGVLLDTGAGSEHGVWLRKLAQ